MKSSANFSRSLALITQSKSYRSLQVSLTNQISNGWDRDENKCCKIVQTKWPVGNSLI